MISENFQSYIIGQIPHAAVDEIKAKAKFDVDRNWLSPQCKDLSLVIILTRMSDRVDLYCDEFEIDRVETIYDYFQYATKDAKNAVNPCSVWILSVSTAHPTSGLYP